LTHTYIHARTLERFKVNCLTFVACSRTMRWVTEEAEDTKGNAKRTIQLVVLDTSSKFLTLFEFGRICLPLVIKKLLHSNHIS
jgi:hypothetical protein